MIDLSLATGRGVWNFAGMPRLEFDLHRDLQH